MHGKKMIAPIIISIIVVVYYVVFFGFVMSELHSVWAKLICGIIPAVVAGLMSYVCVQRINEIRKGEEDDLSQY